MSSVLFVVSSWRVITELDKNPGCDVKFIRWNIESVAMFACKIIQAHEIQVENHYK